MLMLMGDTRWFIWRKWLFYVGELLGYFLGQFRHLAFGAKTQARDGTRGQPWAQSAPPPMCSPLKDSLLFLDLLPVLSPMGDISR